MIIKQWQLILFIIAAICFFPFILLLLPVGIIVFVIKRKSIMEKLKTIKENGIHIVSNQSTTPTQSSNKTNINDLIVYVSPTGKSYHQDPTCISSGNLTKIKLKDAKKKNYKKCSKCCGEYFFNADI